MRSKLLTVEDAEQLFATFAVVQRSDGKAGRGSRCACKRHRVSLPPRRLCINRRRSSVVIAG